jgi:hypothetical protein
MIWARNSDDEFMTEKKLIKKLVFQTTYHFTKVWVNIKYLHFSFPFLFIHSKRHFQIELETSLFTLHNYQYWQRIKKNQISIYLSCITDKQQNQWLHGTIIPITLCLLRKFETFFRMVFDVWVILCGFCQCIIRLR